MAELVEGSRPGGPAAAPGHRQRPDRLHVAVPGLGFPARSPRQGGPGCLDRVGVEGTGSYGVGVARALRAADIAVVEVDRPNRMVRRRLNRGGDRQANAALWRIAMVRMRSDPRTRTYVARRVEEGRSKPEIIRVLKRYIAREVYRHLPRG